MFELYPYQERVLDKLMQKKNVILVTPTGSGKTDASIIPFFQNRLFCDQCLPYKALYVVPMRVLATQFQTSCQKLLDEDIAPEYFAKLTARYQHFGRELLSIQTGDSPLDPCFESMITACTIDQLLASALGMPYGVSARQANINVAAVSSSYLIIDEPHLYPLAQDGRSYQGALTTCLEMLRLLKGVNRFILMSATMSRPLVEKLAQMLDAEVITASAEELVALNKERQRAFIRATAPLDAQAVLTHHDRCTLAVCNTVQRAQELYLHLDALLKHDGRDIELKLLHSRFTDADRKQQGEDLQRLLGKEQWINGEYQGEKDVIVIATQVVEVGLDISVQVLHTELAPANSIVQRAGRCARFEQQHGQVRIYPLGEDEQGQPVSPLPYPAELCRTTWDALAAYDQQVVGFAQEQEIINQVHSTADLDLLARYEAHRDELQDTITTRLQDLTRNQSTAANLIRDVTQIQIILHDEPEEITTEPWRYESFGVHPGQLQGKHWQRLKNYQAELGLDWLCKKPILKATAQPDDEEDNRAVNTYTWDHVTNPEEVVGALMIALPGQLATYHPALGLVFLDGRLPLSESWRQQLQEHPYQSSKRERSDDAVHKKPTRQQNYEQHIGGLADAYHYVLYDELSYSMSSLEERMYLKPGSIDHAIQLAIATHDLGKLDRRWQRWARAWQRLRYEKGQWSTPYHEPASSFFFAKTNYLSGSSKERDWQQELSQQGIKRPHHACEGVAVSRRFLRHSLGILNGKDPMMAVLRATCTAIAHHHTTDAHEYGETHIHPSALPTIDTALKSVQRESPWAYDLAQLTLELKKGEFPKNVTPPALTRCDVSDEQARLETWLAFLIVRALRLADQRADFYAL
ncbi:CRISPR-associated helicase Cas3' [Dictyobacter arantiisoli]|uniref:CRISPR-associated helicase/endonuclease Cas3 n=1 Tax=Dictyobacter arantiisoli TaxID=2014874 RepID=A0A5A5TJQ2_9CHLR|nr:CRISPR-associated helicase Cas3' [Dictyobacter arantiisoli]GCF11249.1 CRISPR-associated helicase/endonuclease Cas3 [Dictyobacter arantiisoli]